MLNRYLQSLYIFHKLTFLLFPASSPTRKNNNEGFSTKLEQNKAALQSLLNSTINTTTTMSSDGSEGLNHTGGELTGDNSLVSLDSSISIADHSCVSSHHSSNDEDVFQGAMRSASQQGSLVSLVEEEDYLSIQNEDQLQTLVSCFFFFLTFLPATQTKILF